MYCSLFLISHLCVLTGITWKLWAIYGCCACQTTALLHVWETFCLWSRVVWEIQLESYAPRQESIVLWYKIMYVYYKCMHTSLFGGQLRLTTKVTYLMSTYYTPKEGFTGKDASFYNNNVGDPHYTLHCLFNQSCTLILLSYILLYKFAAKQKEKKSIN